MSDLYELGEASRKKANLVWETRMKNTPKSTRDDKITAIMCQAVDDDQLYNRPLADGTPYYVHEVALKGLHDAGYIVVPVKPSEEMIEAGQDCFVDCYADQCSDAAKHIWGSMIEDFKL